MTDIGRARSALLARVLEGEGVTSRAERRAAFDGAVPEGPAGALIRKVAGRACEVGDEDFAAVRGSGLDEDAIFEVVVCGALGAATRQYEAALAALRVATAEE